jgi:hypothetical protein
MTRIPRISIGQMYFTTVPDKRVTEISAALDAQRANRRTAIDDIDRGTAERNVADLETALEQANVNLQAHTNLTARLEAERNAQQQATEQRRQEADELVKAREKAMFLTSNRTASEADFERLWPAMRDQMLIDQRDGAIAAARASGNYRF